MEPANRASPTLSPNDSLVPLESVLRTEELHRRPSRLPDFETEHRALDKLVQALADSPHTILQTLADTILEVFRAGSAGVSLLTKDEKRFYWPATAGAWRPHIGGGMPRDSSPCGLVLDRDAAQLFARPERYYHFLVPIQHPIVEALLTPFYVEGKAVGTIWAIAHDDRRKFDAEDLRQLERLGRFASAAYRAVAALDMSEQRGSVLQQSLADLQQAQDSRRAALNLMEDTIRSRQATDRLNGQLRESEARFRNLILTLPLALYTTAREGRITLFNDAAARLWGRRPEIGRDMWCGSWKIFQADETPLPTDECSTTIALRGGSAGKGVEVIVERPDKTRSWVLPYPQPLRDPSGNITGTINLLVDISERKQAEAVLRQNERLFSTLVEQAPVGVYVVDDKLRLQQVNSRALPMFDAVHPLIGRAFSDVVQILWGPAVGRQLGDIFRHTLETGEQYISPNFCERRHDLGVVQSYDWETQRVTLPDGAHGVVCYFTDITDRKRAEEELEQRVVDRTKELVQSHGRLRALTTELTLTEQRERQRLAMDLHDYLAQLLVVAKMKVGQGKRLAKRAPGCAELFQETDTVLNDALNYTRTLVIDLSPPILHEFGLPAALRWLGERMQRHELAVTVQIDSDDLPLPEDHAVLLFQSVRELLMNAVKHAQSDAVTVRVEQESGVLRIEVRDQGAGFDPAVAESPVALSSKFGLFSIRERMKALGGWFDLQSTPGQGTTALLALPLGGTLTDTSGLKRQA